MARELIAATTSQVKSAAFRMSERETPAQITAVGLAGSEVVQLEVSGDGGVTWNDTGSVNDLTLAEPSKCLDCKGIYRVNKDATVGASSVFMSNSDEDL